MDENTRCHGHCFACPWFGFPGAFMLPFAAVVFQGCAHMNDPFKDPGEAIEVELTTPSADGFAGRAEFGRPFRRDWEAATAEGPRGDVSHWPLWWEDPFEDKGNADKPTPDREAADLNFAWAWVDYLHIAYGAGRLLLNTVAWPVSAVVTPPGTLMASDGRISRGPLGYDHDARRADSLEVEPPDVVTTGKHPVPAVSGPAHAVDAALQEVGPAEQPPSDSQPPMP